MAVNKTITEIKHIREKTAIIAIVETSDVVRRQISIALKSLGFENVISFANIAEIWRHLATSKDTPDWVFSSLYALEKKNGISLLRYILENKRLHNVRVSLLLDDAETSNLPLAFELGLLSWHKKPFTNETLQRELEHLIISLGKHEWNATMTSSEYLREHFKRKQQYMALAELEESMLIQFPSNSKILLNLAETYFLLKDIERAKKMVIQAQFLDPRSKRASERLIYRYSPDLLEVALEQKISNQIGINTCLVIDKDVAILKLVKDIMSRLKVPTVETFEDGETAWRWLQTNSAPQLIIQEWSLPKLGGMEFLQRVRARDELFDVPIIVMSAQVKSNEQPLLSEMSVTNLIVKPFSTREFLLALKYSILQERKPTEQKSMERKIFSALKDHRLEDGLDLKNRYVSLPSVSDSRKLYIESETAYYFGDYTRAKNYAIQSCRLGGQDLLWSMNVLARSLMKQEEFEPAIKFYEKAQLLSPKNLIRMCELSEAYLGAGHPDKASETISAAKKIDPESTLIKETELKIAVSSNDTKTAREIMAEMDSLSEVISLLNNKAVNLIRSGKFEDGVNVYKRTLMSLPKKEKELKIIVSYNLALAYARVNDLENCLIYVESAILEESPVKTKAESLISKVKKVMKEGGKVSDFLSSGKKSASAATKYSRDRLSIDSDEPIEPGTMCLHGVFCFPDSHTPESLALLKT